jgi:hypothetical protein
MYTLATMVKEAYTGALQVTSGTIDGVVIGGTTPAAGSFGIIKMDSVDDTRSSVIKTEDSGAVTITSDRFIIRPFVPGSGVNAISKIITRHDALSMTSAGKDDPFAFDEPLITSEIIIKYDDLSITSGGKVDIAAPSVSIVAATGVDIAAPSVSIVASTGVDITTVDSGDITIRAMGGGAKTVAVVRLDSNVFAVEKFADLTAEETAAAPDNRQFAVHGSGVTQMSIDTIVLNPDVTTISPIGAELRRFTIIDARAALDGDTYTLALADGIYGQVKTFSIGEKSDVGSAYVTITPTSRSFTHVVLSAISSGQSVTLAYTDKWHIVSGTHIVDIVWSE